MKRIIVIGGVAAGMSAASKAARAGRDVEITVYTQEQYISYSACSLPYLAEGLIANEDELIARTPEQMAASGVRVLPGHRALSFDPQQKRVRVQTPAGAVIEDAYDTLILATGAAPIVPAALATGLSGVFTVKTIPDVQRIQAFLGQRAPKEALVIGGGLIGIEMADALTKRGLCVTIVEKAPQLLSVLDADMAALVADHLRENGVSVRCDCGVTGFAGDAEGNVRAVTTDAGEFDASLVILAIGVLPRSELASAAGARLGAKNAILVDAEMRTSLPDVFAAGDCATARHIVTGRDVFIPLGTTANKQGRIAGENAVDGHKAFWGVAGASIFRVFGWDVARTGLTLREAEAEGFAAWAQTITSNTRASGYPGRGPITVKLVLEDKTNRILGGQIFGAEGAGKRIDVLTAMVQSAATAETLSELDLAYAPPFSPVWDPLLVAANQAVSAAKKR